MNSNASKPKIKALAFDVDGTLTPLREHHIPDFLYAALAKIPNEIKVTLCTGRPLEDLHSKLKKLGRHWDVIVENGGLIYRWDGKKYECIRKLKFSAEIDMEKMKKVLNRSTFFVSTIRESDSRLGSGYYWLQPFPRIMAALSRLAQKRIIKAFTREGWMDEVEVLCSGIGNLILPKGSGKGPAMEWWCKDQNIPHENLVCLGDNAQPGGNDESMLNDPRWRGISVGNPGMSSESIFDKDGKRLHGPEAVAEFLLHSIC